MESVDALLVDRTVNGYTVNVNTIDIKALLIENLSNPITYNIGRYYKYGESYVKTVHIGEGKDKSIC